MMPSASSLNSLSLDSSADRINEPQQESQSATLTDVLAPYVLLRFASLPYALLNALQPGECLAALDQFRSARSQMRAQSELLTEALFSLVSRIAADDKNYRRKVLQLKREIHAETPTGLSAEILARIGADLSEPAEHQAFADWCSAQAQLSEAWQQAEQSYLAERQQVLRPGLRAALKEPWFRRALALASPGVAAHAGREKKLPTKDYPDNYERSLFSYLIRSAAKTSPFSSFMSTTALRIDPAIHGAPEFAQVQHQCRTRLNRGLVARLQRQAIQATGDEQAMLRVNPTLTALQGQRFRALCERDLVILGRPWRQQNRSSFQLHPMVSGVLSQHSDCVPRTEWARRFSAAGVPAERSLELVKQLTERGLFQNQILCDAFVEAPEQVLLDFLEQHTQAAESAANLSTAAQAVRAMLADCAALNQDAETGSRLATAGESAPRETYVQRIREHEQQAAAALGAGQAEAYQNVVLEDCWSSTGASGLGADQLSDLEDLRGFLCTQLGWSPQFLRLRERFVQHFGDGGECRDVLEFLTEYGTHLTEALEYGERFHDEAAQRAPDSARLGVTAQVQLVGQGSDRPPQVVVNKVFEGPAWLTARFAFGDTPEHEQLRQGLRQWLQSVAGDREPVDVLFNGDCNDLQAHPRLTERVLRWPGEALHLPEQHQLDLRQLRIQHDAEQGTLNVFDAHNRPLHLCYLGSTVPSPSWGIPYALSILTQPYRLLRPAQAPSSTERASSIEFVPRKMAGRVVIRRALWWVPVSYLQQAWFSANGAQRLLQVGDECQQLQLPSVFYARRPLQAASHGANASSQSLEASRKPLWVDTRNPFCLHLLERLCEGMEWISFTEALPGPEHHWLQIAGQDHVAELQVEMMLGGGLMRQRVQV